MSLTPPDSPPLPTKPLHAVLYADGSCRPQNPGYIGWGVHGYWYQETSEKPVNVDRFVVTSRGYLLNTDPAAVGQYVKPDQYVDAYGSSLHIASNNNAEIEALHYALTYVKGYKGVATVRVYTDSEYLCNCINDWCKRWSRSGWLKQDGTPVSNRKQLEPLYQLYKDLGQDGISVTLEWIRGHNEHVGNDRADMLAGIGSNCSKHNRLRNVTSVIPAAKFWKNTADRHPYLAARRLYFNSIAEHHGPGTYYLVSSAEDEGSEAKPSSSTGLAVVSVAQPDPIVEQVMERQFSNSAGLNSIILMNLDELFGKNIYPWVKQYDYALMGLKNSHSMSLVNRYPVTEEKMPAGLLFRTLENFEILEELLDQYKAHKLAAEDVKPEIRLTGFPQPVRLFDVTDQFFHQVPYGNKGGTRPELLPVFVVGYKSMHLTISDHPDAGTLRVPYTLGYDCLPRNQLKHLESQNPKIQLLTWISGSTLHYATIIDSDLGVGIWSNFFASRILLPQQK